MALTKRRTLKDKRNSESWYFETEYRSIHRIDFYRDGVKAALLGWSGRIVEYAIRACIPRCRRNARDRDPTRAVSPCEHRACPDSGESVWPRGGRGRKSEWNKEKKKKSGGPDWLAIGPSPCRGHACLYVCAAPRSFSAPMCISRCLRYLLFSISIPSRAPFNSRPLIRRDHRYRFYHVHSYPCLYSAFDFFPPLLSFLFLFSNRK